MHTHTHKHISNCAHANAIPIVLNIFYALIHIETVCENKEPFNIPQRAAVRVNVLHLLPCTFPITMCVHCAHCTPNISNNSLSCTTKHTYTHCHAYCSGNTRKSRSAFKFKCICLQRLDNENEQSSIPSLQLTVLHSIVLCLYLQSNNAYLLVRLCIGELCLQI